jgi:succinate-acetate transporter protein
MGDTKATLIDQRYLGSSENLIRTHTRHHPLTVFMGYGLFWSYITAAVVVLLNMLIAMMSNSFQEIYVCRILGAYPSFLLLLLVLHVAVSK